MVTQVILVTDEFGNFTGEYIPKEVGHSGEGKRHLAITVLIYNNRDQVLLQRRKHQVFDDIWDITGATHPLHLTNRDETVAEATQRCLKREYNIEGVALKNLGSFNYFAKYDNLCENEHCYLLVGEYNGLVKLNPEVGYEYKWIQKDEFLQDIKINPDKYSAWAKEAVKILEKNGFFN
ncbi:MAG: NUDIX domain-containing protein [Candidatus Daviesbacteria bacterium]|nr:MAG: NUDIX domain-containing protein [Candidatus Daviesbacteria bacterium]